MSGTKVLQTLKISGTKVLEQPVVVVGGYEPLPRRPI